MVGSTPMRLRHSSDVSRPKAKGLGWLASTSAPAALIADTDGYLGIVHVFQQGNQIFA